MMSNKVISEWYIVNEISENIFWVREPGFVSFFIFRNDKKALLIDSGLGLSLTAAKELFTQLNIQEYDVICTHGHCDHIGLNGNAKNIGISNNEWEKFEKQNEKNQLLNFLTMLEKNGKKPSILNEREILGFNNWIPTHFLASGQLINFANWKFEVKSVPGHTCGSLMFHELTTNFLFSGDVIYTGKMYMHLKDSDIDDFYKSIEKLCTLKEIYPRLKVWPSHNVIPLPDDYPKKVQRALGLHSDGELPVVGKWQKDLIFEEGLIYSYDGVEIVVRSK
ncbi:MAG: MBL fold metallo-hydrolase [Bdellovibrionaceae bacterium]|nr:MBL fold metallo-hydrolase [Bdellovibrio sp.]